MELESESIWSSFNFNSVQHYPAPLYLYPGSIGAASLLCKKDVNGGKEARFEWEESTAQIEDLRIKPSNRYKPILVYPSTIYAQDEPEDRDRNGDLFSKTVDTTLLNQFSSIVPDEPLNPAILLGATLSSRNILNPNEGPYLNYGNCLSIVNVPSSSSSSSSSTEVGSSRAVWRSGDENGRPNSITSGAFVSWSRSQNVPSRKGKGRQVDRDDMEVDSLTFSSASPETPTRHPLFQPDSSPAITKFHSPIFQIQTAPLLNSTSSYLCATRTSTQFTLFQLSSSSPSSSSNEVNNSTILTEFNYPFRELGLPKPLADFTLGGIRPRYGQLGSGMMVDIQGNLWGWGLEETTRIGGGGSGRQSRPEMFRLRKGVKRKGGNEFARVIYGGSRGLDAVVGFQDEVLLYDLRTAKASTTLLDIDILFRNLPLGRSQAPSIITSLLSPSPKTSLLSSNLEATHTPTSIHVVCSDRDIIWLDDRMPNRDLMRWNHGRAGKLGRGTDTSLEIMEIGNDEVGNGNEGTIERILLHSKIQPHLSIYTYSSNVSTAPRSLLDPYSLPSPTPNDQNPFIRTGLAIVPTDTLRDEKFKQGARREKDWLIMESRDDGSVHSRYISLTKKEEEEEVKEDGEEISLLDEERRVWCGEVEELAAKAESNHIEAEVEPEESLGKEVNLEIVRKEILGIPLKKEEEKEEEKEVRGKTSGQSEVILGLAVEALKSIEEDEEIGDRGILTAFDLVSIVADKLGFTSEENMDADHDLNIPPLPRSSTFTSNLSSSSRSLLLPLDKINRSLEVASNLLVESSEWSTKLLNGRAVGSKSLRETLIPDLPGSFDQMAKISAELKNRYTASKKESKEDRTMIEACDTLILDTTLSSQVYSSRPITIDPLPTLPHSVNKPYPSKEEPPPLHFTYFRPTPNVDNEEDETEEDDFKARKRPSLNSPGARALLSEWHVGTDPHSYVWSNPYEEEKRKEPEVFDTSKNKKKKNDNKSKKRNRNQSSPPPFPSSSSSTTSTSTSGGDSSPISIQVRFQPFIGLPTPLRRVSTIREEFDSPMETASQPIFSTNSFPASSSQPSLFGASQILPGAFGGRNLEKDKKAKGKKRVSGF